MATEEDLNMLIYGALIEEFSASYRSTGIVGFIDFTSDRL